MTYAISHIAHECTEEKLRVLKLIDLFSVWEPDGSIQNLVRSELDSYRVKGKGIAPFHIVTAHNEAGAFVGYAFYYPASKTVETYVLPHLRGKGIGSELIQGIRYWSGTSALAGYSGFGAWREFFESNFIVCLDDYRFPSKEQIVKYGSVIKAQSTALAAAKRKASMQYRKYLELVAQNTPDLVA